VDSHPLAFCTRGSSPHRALYRCRRHLLRYLGLPALERRYPTANVPRRANVSRLPSWMLVGIQNVVFLGRKAKLNDQRKLTSLFGLVDVSTRDSDPRRYLLHQFKLLRSLAWLKPEEADRGSLEPRRVLPLTIHGPKCSGDALVGQGNHNRDCL
jgi:hypothetical protein